MIITILRKPLEGTVADNTLKHGCGGLNIDECRVGDVVQNTSKNARSSDSHKNTVYQSGLKDNFEGRITEGRWPTNFVLIHLEGCELKGTKKIKGNNNGRISKSSMWIEGRPIQVTDYTDENGLEEMSNWDCVEGCPVKKLDENSDASRFFKPFKKEEDNP